jgi:hypothetical protein
MPGKHSAGPACHAITQCGHQDHRVTPCLPQALRVSVGQLGIIGRLKMKIVKEVPVRRYVALLQALYYIHDIIHILYKFYSVCS